MSLDSKNSYAYKIKALILIAQNKKAEACVELKKSLSLGYTEKYGNEVSELLKQYCE